MTKNHEARHYKVCSSTDDDDDQYYSYVTIWRLKIWRDFLVFNLNDVQGFIWYLKFLQYCFQTLNWLTSASNLVLLNTSSILIGILYFLQGIWYVQHTVIWIIYNLYYVFVYENLSFWSSSLKNYDWDILQILR